MNFFIYDTLKIFILLSVIIFATSIIRSYLPPEKIRVVLSYKNKYAGNYIISGLFIAIISGFIIGKMKVENLVELFVYENKINGGIEIKIL